MRADAPVVPRQRRDLAISGVLLALLEVADVEDEQPVLRRRRRGPEIRTEHGHVRRVPVLRELDIVPLRIRNVRRCSEEAVGPATCRPGAARERLRIRSIGGVDRFDADIRTQRRDVVRFSIRRPLAGVPEAPRDDDGRFLHRVLAVGRDVVDGKTRPRKVLRGIGPLGRPEQLARCVHFERLPRVEHRRFREPCRRGRMCRIGHVHHDGAAMRLRRIQSLVEVGTVLPGRELPARTFSLILADHVGIAVEALGHRTAGDLRLGGLALQPRFRLVALAAVRDRDRCDCERGQQHRQRRYAGRQHRRVHVTLRRERLRKGLTLSVERPGVQVAARQEVGRASQETLGPQLQSLGRDRPPR